MASLTVKQRKFVNELLRDPNMDAVQAARKAGYSEKNIHAAAWSLMRNSKVQEQISSVVEARQERVRVSQDDVLRELVAIVMFDPRELYQEDGTLKRVKDLPPEVARCLTHIEVKELFSSSGNHRDLVGYISKVRWIDRLRAIEMLARHLGMFNDKLTVTNREEKVLRLEVDSLKSQYSADELRTLLKFVQRNGGGKNDEVNNEPIDVTPTRTRQRLPI